MAKTLKKSDAKEHSLFQGYPKSNSVVSHNTSIDLLLKMLSSNKLHNGIIFKGLSGVGKATVAINLAKFILSYNKSFFNNKSFTAEDIKDVDLNTSLQIDNNSHPSFLLVGQKYDEKRKRYKDLIGVDDIREIHSFLSLSSDSDKYKIVIIDSLESLNINAFNSLLKVLEESPRNVVFFLVSHNYSEVPETIKSRCISLLFNSLTYEEINKIIDINNIQMPVRERNEIIALANGSISNLMWYLKEDNLKLYKLMNGYFKNIKNEEKYKKLYSFLSSITDIDIYYAYNLIETCLLKYSNSNNIEEYYSTIQKVHYLKTNTSVLYLDKIQSILSLISRLRG